VYFNAVGVDFDACTMSKLNIIASIFILKNLLNLKFLPHALHVTPMLTEIDEQERVLRRIF
jgi:hypothetical protein